MREFEENFLDDELEDDLAQLFQNQADKIQPTKQELDARFLDIRQEMPDRLFQKPVYRHTSFWISSVASAAVILVAILSLQFFGPQPASLEAADKVVIESNQFVVPEISMIENPSPEFSQPAEEEELDLSLLNLDTDSTGVN